MKKEIPSSYKICRVMEKENMLVSAAVVYLVCSFVSGNVVSQDGQDHFKTLFTELSVPFELVSNVEIKSPPNPALAATMRNEAAAGKNALAMKRPDYVLEVETGLISKKRIVAISKDGQTYKGTVTHQSKYGPHAVFEYFASKGQGLIVVNESASKIELKNPSISTYTDLTTAFPSATVVSLLPSVRQIVKGSEDGRSFYDLSFHEGIGETFRVFVSEAFEVEEIQKRSSSGVVRKRTIVTDWDNIQGGQRRVPKAVEVSTFDHEGIKGVTSTWTIEKLNFLLDEDEVFDYKFKPGYSVTDSISGQTFWSNDILKDGWETK